LVEAAGGASPAPSIDCGGVLSPDTSRKLAIVSRGKTVLVLVFVFLLAGFLGKRFSASQEGTDFPDFYCAARMLAEGRGRQLYDADLQRQYQARYTGRVGTLNIHPPFEALLYLAVAGLPLRRAYLLWSLLNVAFLAVGLHRLAKDALQPWNWSALLAAALIFVPVLLCLLQGQDSLLLLLLVVLGFTHLRREKPFAAGCWLGLGLFKFQIGLPLMLVLLLTQGKSARSGLARGFCLVALMLTGVSVAISGWSVFTAYPRFLLSLKAQPFAGVIPQAMANFRGLTYFFLRSDQSAWAIAAMVALSGAALARTLLVWEHAESSSQQTFAAATRDEFDLGFANTVLFALLVSYHLNPHDLTLLLLPIALLLRRALAPTPRRPDAQKWTTVGLLGILFLPPMHLLALRAGDYALVSLPLLALFLSAASNARPETSAQR
jgi:Glycosyltransferase family 87